MNQPEQTVETRRECWCCVRIWKRVEVGWKRDDDGGDVPGGSLCPDCVEEYA
jgi:hypothetical protein